MDKLNTALIGVVIVFAILILGILVYVNDDRSTDTMTTSETPATVEHSNALARLDESDKVGKFEDEPYVLVFYDENKEISYDLYQGYIQATTEDQTIVPYTHFIEFSADKTQPLKEQLDVTEPSIVFSSGEMIGTTPIRGYTASNFQSYFKNLSVNTFRNIVS